METGVKAIAFLEAEVKQMDGGATARCTWKPHYKIMVRNSQGSEVVVGCVQVGDDIAWDEQAVRTHFECTCEVLDEERKAFRRQ